MCGIAGIKLFNNLASKTDEALMNSALRLQNHRGPDSTNILVDGSILFGHNRLSIIDTNSRSNQPFQDENKRYSLVYNGEIYNFKAIKKELEKKGIVFKTTSDTEVLFYLLINKKEKALEELRGCFAFGFYDNKEDYLLLARDRMGINPLLYSISDEKITFGSELFIFPSLGAEKNISQVALNYYFQFTYIPAPHTIYESVKKLLPGHYLQVKNKEVSISRYWNPENENKYAGNFNSGKKELYEKVNFAVKSQLEADVPIGTFLSGGVDSSIVSALVSEEKNDLHTFSVSFEAEKSFDESEYALAVAKHIQSKHHVIKLKESDFKDNFLEILSSFDEPFADSSAIAMWFLSQETAKHLKVALSGDGADELFGGYNKHKAYISQKQTNNLLKVGFSQTNRVLNPLIKKVNTKIAHKINKYSELIQLNWPDNYWYLASNIGEKQKNSLLIEAKKHAFDLNIENDHFDSFLLKDQLFVLSNDMLKKVDIMSMHHSLEVRTPFMDKDLVKFANSLPVEWKITKKTGKYILKEAFKEKLPSIIFDRKKQGFEVPLNKWIKNNWHELISTKWFDENFVNEQKLFNFEGVKRMEKEFMQNIGTSSQEMWAYIVFQHWYQNFHVNA